MKEEVSKEAWEILFSLPLGKVVGWLIVFAAIISGLFFCVLKAYKVFSKYMAIKNENTEQKERLKKHDNQFNELKESLDEIKRGFKDLEEVSYKQLKYTLIRTCEDAIRDGFISTGRLSFLEEMYKEYVEIFNGNGYVKTLVEKVRELPVVGDPDR